MSCIGPLFPKIINGSFVDRCCWRVAPVSVFGSVRLPALTMHHALGLVRVPLLGVYFCVCSHVFRVGFGHRQLCHCHICRRAGQRSTAERRPALREMVGSMRGCMRSAFRCSANHSVLVFPFADVYDLGAGLGCVPHLNADQPAAGLGLVCVPL